MNRAFLLLAISVSLYGRSGVVGSNITFETALNTYQKTPDSPESLQKLLDAYATTNSYPQSRAWADNQLKLMGTSATKLVQLKQETQELEKLLTTVTEELEKWEADAKLQQTRNPVQRLAELQKLTSAWQTYDQALDTRLAKYTSTGAFLEPLQAIAHRRAAMSAALEAERLLKEEQNKTMQQDAAFQQLLSAIGKEVDQQISALAQSKTLTQLQQLKKQWVLLNEKIVRDMQPYTASLDQLIKDNLAQHDAIGKKYREFETHLEQALEKTAAQTILNAYRASKNRTAAKAELDKLKAQHTQQAHAAPAQPIFEQSAPQQAQDNWLEILHGFSDDMIKDWIEPIIHVDEDDPRDGTTKLTQDIKDAQDLLIVAKSRPSLQKTMASDIAELEQYIQEPRYTTKPRTLNQK